VIGKFWQLVMVQLNLSTPPLVGRDRSWGDIE